MTTIVPPTRKPLAVHIRWMIRGDMSEVLGIETANFEFAWDEAEFIHWLRSRNVIGLVAEHGERVCGFMLYELLPKSLHIVNFAIHAACQRRGVGAAMVGKLKSKLSRERRRRITANVRETNLDACMFFKAQGFEAVDILRGHYEDSPEDAYVFEYRS